MMQTRELRELIEVEHEVVFWGKTYTITPRFVGKAFGDGQALMWLEPLATRPNYYVVRIDSAWFDGRGDATGPLYDHIDDVLWAIDEEYSSIEQERQYLIDGGVPEEDADLADYPDELGWPALDDSCGYSWGPYAWPGEE